MNKGKLVLEVRGKDSKGKRFSTEVTFNLIRPNANDYYGNGCYMDVYLDGCAHYIDVRYSGTTDLEKLANFWIKDYFGPNAKEVRKIA